MNRRGARRLQPLPPAGRADLADFLRQLPEQDGELHRTRLRRDREDQQALQGAEALDGYYVLLCSWPKEQASERDLRVRYKPEEVIERRFSDWKGPLRVRPVFVTPTDSRDSPSNVGINTRWREGTPTTSASSSPSA